MAKSVAQTLERRINPPSPFVVNVYPPNITVHPPDVNVTVEPATMNITVEATRLDEFQDGTIMMDGTEQTLLEYTEVARIMGYIDLSNMQAGDVVVIRQYLRVKPGEAYKKYADETYLSLQTVPLVYLTPKESDYGMKITVEQTVGVLKSFDYNFIREK